MDRKESINKLKEIKAALDRRDEKSSEITWTTYERFLDEDEPQKPSEPFEKPVMPSEMNKPYEPQKHNSYSKEAFFTSSFSDWFDEFGGNGRILFMACGGLGCLLVFAVFVCTIMNFGSFFSEMGDFFSSLFAFDFGFEWYYWPFAILLLDVIVFVVTLLIVCIVISVKCNIENSNHKRRCKQHDEEWYENAVKQYRQDLDEYNEYQKRYPSLVDEYKKKQAIYNEYLNRLAEYNRIQEGRKDAALARLETYKSSAYAENEENFQKELVRIDFDYPEKYYPRIGELISIMKDMRADNLKEAINVLIEDDHKADMLSEQARLVEAQEEYNREQERFNQSQEWESQRRYKQEQERLQQERESQRRKEYEAQREAQKRNDEEQKRISDARHQCDSCTRWLQCPMHGKITDICPNYIHK